MGVMMGTLGIGMLVMGTAVLLMLLLLLLLTLCAYLVACSLSFSRSFSRSRFRAASFSRSLSSSRSRSFSRSFSRSRWSSRWLRSLRPLRPLPVEVAEDCPDPPVWLLADERVVPDLLLRSWLRDRFFLRSGETDLLRDRRLSFPFSPPVLVIRERSPGRWPAESM
uniref:Putative secreted peptide n=1 Tax=Anopheles braziliensis TaxID=58242 RepID=A0A2M3ZRP5_9DIPT